MKYFFLRKRNERKGKREEGYAAGNLEKNPGQLI